MSEHTKLKKNHFKRSKWKLILPLLILLGIAVLLISWKLGSLTDTTAESGPPVKSAHPKEVAEETSIEETTDYGFSSEDETVYATEEQPDEEQTYAEIELTNDTDTFEWLYQFLNSREVKLLTEGEYLTVKNKLEGRDDELSQYILSSGDNFFSKEIDDDKFYELYYNAIEANKETDWLSNYTKAYFSILGDVVTDENADMSAVINAIDEGSYDLRATPGTEPLIALLRANYNGLIEEMPYYDSAAILSKADKVSKEHPELDEIFNKLRSKYNTVN